jgi:DNA-binding response OmpR family regulator
MYVIREVLNCKPGKVRQMLEKFRAISAVLKEMGHEPLRLLTRDEILDNLWGADYVAESNVVDRHIRNLRIKLQNHSRQRRYIATVPGRGYRFITPSTDASASQPRG